MIIFTEFWSFVAFIITLCVVGGIAKDLLLIWMEGKEYVDDESVDRD